VQDTGFSILCSKHGISSAETSLLGQNSKEASKMKNVCRVFLPTLACLTLIAPAWALPPAATHSTSVLALSSGPNTPQEQSVSGKIASVDKSSFTLTVGQSRTSSERQDLQQDPAGPKTMAFQIDKNTTIEGSLKVGANADVTYRQEKGANVAISVHVAP
jgi:hypothetical protein